MDCKASFIPYAETHQFSALVNDYLAQKRTLNPFYRHKPDLQGIQDAIAERRKFPVDRPLLVEALQRTHASRPMTAQQSRHLESLLKPTTFTVCTAHQPNLFTGYLYFVYKILHTISLAEYLKTQIPEHDFVPVFWMGSEDNDLDELGQFRLYDNLHRWETRQTGAVGRMLVDRQLLRLIDTVEGSLGMQPHGQELISMLRDSYVEGITIAEATFRFVNHLFADYGLLILQPDQPDLKRAVAPLFRDDLKSQQSYLIVQQTARELGTHYKVQVNPREVNLFYLEEGSRQRLIRQNNIFFVDGTEQKFTAAEMLAELDSSPEKFSPNVILRGIYQETVLPNLAFIGGGSEVAYWMELRPLFEFYRVPYPVVLLRNSFLLITNAQDDRILKAGWEVRDLFQSEQELMKQMVARESTRQLDLQQEKQEAERLYHHLGKVAGSIDPTLTRHVQALGTQALNRIRELEKKMFRAEKRNHEIAGNRIMAMKSELFPGNGLQERYDNILPYLARYGKEVIRAIYLNSPALEMEFGVLTLGDSPGST